MQFLKQNARQRNRCTCPHPANDKDTVDRMMHSLRWERGKAAAGLRWWRRWWWHYLMLIERKCGILSHTIKGKSATSKTKSTRSKKWEMGNKKENATDFSDDTFWPDMHFARQCPTLSSGLPIYALCHRVSSFVLLKMFLQYDNNIHYNNYNNSSSNNIASCNRSCGLVFLGNT